MSSVRAQNLPRKKTHTKRKQYKVGLHVHWKLFEEYGIIHTGNWYKHAHLQ